MNLSEEVLLGNASVHELAMGAFLDLRYPVLAAYVPLILLALPANTLVIVVVLKYHYMRR